MQQDVGLIKNFTSDGQIEKRRLISFGSKEGHIKRAAVGDKLLGVSGIRGAKAAGERVDACLDRIRTVEYGGVVAYGDPLTADADSRAVKAEPGAGEKVWIIGFAMEAGKAGTHGSTTVQPQQLIG